MTYAEKAAKKERERIAKLYKKMSIELYIGEEKVSEGIVALVRKGKMKVPEVIFTAK